MGYKYLNHLILRFPSLKNPIHEHTSTETQAKIQNGTRFSTLIRDPSATSINDPRFLGCLGNCQSVTHCLNLGILRSLYIGQRNVQSQIGQSLVEFDSNFYLYKELSGSVQFGPEIKSTFPRKPNGDITITLNPGHVCHFQRTSEEPNTVNT